MVMDEEISRLMDGELDGAEADVVYRQLKQLRRQWRRGCATT